MLKKAVLLLVFFTAFNTAIAQNVVQGPFSLKGGNASIELIKNKDESITLQKIMHGNKELIDTYAVGDGVPDINSVFFYPIKNINNIIVLVSWDEKNISAVHYKIYAYDYDEKGTIHANYDVTNDRNLEGYDGYSGTGMTFNYKNASNIKKYLTGNYKH